MRCPPRVMPAKAGIHDRPRRRSRPWEWLAHFDPSQRRPFARLAAAAFDAYLTHGAARHSASV